MPSRAAFLTWLLLLALAAGLGFALLRPRAGGPAATGQVLRESRVPLLLELDRAVQGRGYPEDTDYLEPLPDPQRSMDDGGIPLPLPLRGEFLVPSLPVHEGARLSFGYGIEQVADPAAEGAVISFSVKARAAGGGEWRELLREPLACGAPGSGPLLRRAEAALPAEFAGGRADVLFAADCDRELKELSALPVVLSPVLSSAGVKTPAAALADRVPVLLADLLERYPRAVAEDDEWEHIVHSTTPEFCFALRRDADGTEHPPLPILTSGATAAFESDARHDSPRGGARPALFFDFDHTIARYRLEVPRGDVRLEFAIGVDHRCAGVGCADFIVTADGATVFEESLDPGLHPLQRGWQERSVDLSSFAGRTILLAFRGEVFLRAPRTIELTESVPLREAVRYTLEVKRPRAAFAAPRVVRYEEVARRLSRGKERPSVVFVNVETLRADAPSCYGGHEGITPALDALAREGTRIEQCVVAAPWTSPSVASLFTGLYPPAHGVWSYAESYLPESCDTLAERLRRTGVTTAAFSTNELISPGRNFAQGFESFLLAPYANARQVVAAFEDWLEDNKELQFFAFLHLFEPHHPLNAPGADRERYVPEGLRGRDPDQALQRVCERLAASRPVSAEDEDVRLLKALYLGEVRYLDRQIERLQGVLERAGLAERVVLVVTGDHGEEFCEHGLLGHGSHVFGESVLVPLVLWGPGIVPSGKTLRGPVENASLFATVLELMGVDYDAAAARPALRLDGAAAGGLAYTATAQGIRRIDLAAPSPIETKAIFAVRGARSSLIYSRPGVDRGRDPAECLFFALGEDPGERFDLGAGAPAELEEMKQALLRAHRVASSRRHGLEARQIDEGTRRVLGQLAYLGGVPNDAEGDLFDE
ncbi:MAG: sulfatase [Planctomycetes bacterium]|nr:sulfatase [Planctomycetota bacterium]